MYLRLFKDRGVFSFYKFYYRPRDAVKSKYKYSIEVNESYKGENVLNIL